MKANGGSPVIAGRYSVRERIGVGGTATVLLAEDRVLRRRVAVKRLRQGGSGEERRRIVREARVGAGLSHPNLATIFDVIDDDEGTFVVMEYIEGRPLSALIAEGRLEPRRVVEILRPVASALDHAHGYGVVHRDVKPSNILIAGDGTVKLVDLGAATGADLTRITAENRIVGTLAYLAPERLTGGDQSGREADVYSLGATAYEALSGTAPRAAATVAEAFAEATRGGPPEIRDVLPTASTGLAHTLSRALDPDPSRRQPTATQLVADIEATGPAPHAPALGTAPSGLGPASSGGRKRDRTPWLAAGALLAVALGTVAAVALAGGGGGAPSVAGGPKHGRATTVTTTTATSTATPNTTATVTAPAAPAPPPAGAGATSGAALGARLNDQGYALIQRGDYAGAVPVLRRAVGAFPAGTGDIDYAYALFNLGHALRLSGDPSAAIPILEQRLRIPDQTDVVQRELDAARAAMDSPGGHGPPGLERKPGGAPPGHAHHEDKGD